MIAIYTLLFLILFSLLGNTFIERYQNLKISEKYSKHFYAPYIHRPADVHIHGFSLRQLMQKDLTHQELFKKFIDQYYLSARFYYHEMAQDLLELFENQMTFSENEAKQSEKVCVKTSQDLATFKPKDRLYQSYLYLMHSSQLIVDEPFGYKSLLEFIHSGDNQSLDVKKRASFNLYNTPSEIIETIFGKDVAYDLKVALKNYHDQQKKDQNDLFLKEFISRNRLQNHPYHHLIHFQEPR